MNNLLRALRKLLIGLDVGIFAYSVFNWFHNPPSPQYPTEGLIIIFLVPYWAIWSIAHLGWLVYYVLAKRKGQDVSYPVLFLAAAGLLVFFLLAALL